MDYKIYKLHFSTAVHFGNGNITDTTNKLMADTVFSSLCCEAAKDSEKAVTDFIDMAKNGDFIISDALPYIGQTLYVPKPAVRVEVEENGDSTVKKQFKKLKYIPFDKLTDYLKGALNPAAENSKFKELGKPYVRTLASLRAKDEADPFFVGTYRFSNNSGLYILAGFNTKESEALFEKYIKGLSYSGIGGKKSAGLGKFEYEIMNFSPEKLSVSCGKENIYMNLSVAMANENELEKVLEGASYTLIKRSGFIYSKNYADGEDRRKRDFYAFQSGSCFKKPFEGGIFNVSGSGTHPVYRYAKPLFLEVKA